MTTVPARPRTTELLDHALQPAALVPAFQPIVELATGHTVGFEALARWPQSPGLTPAAVFDVAAASGRVAELDWACRVAAVREALRLQLPAPAALFLNVEPATLGSPPPPEYEALLDAARHRLDVVLELTERDLTDRPAELMHMVEWAREHGWGIAMDDVGAVPDSLALLPFVEPDVVKLDLSLIQQTPRQQQADTMAAVLAHAERTGAVILAEGIETAAHQSQAHALGADYGQGWLLGRPGSIPAGTKVTALPPRVRVNPVPIVPFDLVAGSPRLRRGAKEIVLALSHHIEAQARSAGTTTVLLSAFQHAGRFTPATRLRYRAFGSDLSFVGALGSGLPSEVDYGVRGADLAVDDPLVDEWTVVVVGPHYSGALIARDCGDDGPDMQRRFDFLVTHDRDVVLSAGRSLMRRITALAGRDQAATG